MWIYVMFDLPTNTKAQRKAAAGFRHDLIKDGFQMMQFSVYIRHCATGENALVHINRVETMVPAEGIVTVLKVTDRQFSDTRTFVGRKTTPPPPAPGISLMQIQKNRRPRHPSSPYIVRQSERWRLKHPVSYVVFMMIIIRAQNYAFFPTND